jgi:uncharacterized protein (TIGR02145 family)
MNNYRGDIQWQSSGDSITWVDILGENQELINYIPYTGIQWLRTKIIEQDCPEFLTKPIFINAYDSSQIELDTSIIIIDSLQLFFEPDSIQQLEGVYQYSNVSDQTEIKPGDIIIGTTDDGYLRRVKYSVLNDSILILYTSQATLSDIFADTSFEFSLEMNDMIEGRSTGIDFNTANLLLYNQDGLNIQLEEASLSLNPSWYFYHSFNSSGISGYECSTSGSSLSFHAKFNLQATQATTLINKTDEIASYYKRFVINVYGFPVIIRADVKLLATYSANITSAVSSTIDFDGNCSLSCGVKYENGQWQPIYDTNPISMLEVTQPNGNVSMSVNYSWKPHVDFKIFGVAGPYADILAPTIEVTGTVASPSLDWDLKAEAWLKTSLGAKVEILSNTLANYGPIDFETPRFTYRKPFTISSVSGNNQFGHEGEILSEPIKVRVLDSENYPVSSVPVHCEVISGGGVLSDDIIITDDQGYAEVNWTLGNDPLLLQELNFSVLTGNLAQIQSSPLIINATFIVYPTILTSPASIITSNSAMLNGEILNDAGNEIVAKGFYYGLDPNEVLNWDVIYSDSPSNIFSAEATSLNYDTIYYFQAFVITGDSIYLGDTLEFITTSLCPSTIVDIDGNEYQIVQIDDQCWTKENLRTSKFADGSFITNILDHEEWYTATTPGWCNYGNILANDSVYGKLYNWFTVADPRNLCPFGWHVPTNDEWNSLSAFLGGWSSAGGKMKANYSWNNPNIGATNESGFTALGGGNRKTYTNSNGDTFDFIGFYGSWWSSTEAQPTVSFYRNIVNTDDNLLPTSGDQKNGLSVRCIKDN